MQWETAWGKVTLEMWFLHRGILFLTQEVPESKSALGLALTQA